MPLINIASKLDTKFVLQSEPDEGREPQYKYDIVGNRDASAVNGWGITRDVDEDTFDAWQAANPDMIEFVRMATDQEISAAADPLNTYGYELGLEESLPPTAPPENVDVPHCEQVQTDMLADPPHPTLTCTMGNWKNVPTSYSYQWQVDGTNVGTDSAQYVGTAQDIGKTAVCIVTATNAIGSTAAPPSNAVAVANM